MGKEWVGRLDDIELTKSWVPILNGKGIRETTIAPALDYTDETIFYWDLETSTLALFKLTSRGHVIRGTVTTEEGLIIYEGVSARPDRTITFKRTYEPRPGGTLIDRFYNPEGGKWDLGHTIEYDPKDG